MRSQTCRCIATIPHEPTYDKAVVVVEGVCRRVGIILLFIIAPAMVAELVTEVLRYWCCGVERWLPVHLLAVCRWNVLGRWRLRGCWAVLRYGWCRRVRLILWDRRCEALLLRRWWAPTLLLLLRLLPLMLRRPPLLLLRLLVLVLWLSVLPLRWVLGA